MSETTDRVPSPIKWHGGKHYLAKRIVAMMPPHLHYVEPYAGSLAVLLAKDPEGVSEVANDLDGELSNFWTVMKEPYLFDQFQRRAEATPFSEEEFQAAMRALEMPPALCWHRAWAFFVRCRQSLAGRMRSFSPLVRTRTRRGMSDNVSAWLSAVEGLREVHERMKRVVVLCRPALDVIRKEDGPGTLVYADPPYPAETRTAKDVYRHEMTLDDHRELLRALLACKGKVMLSGYPCALYDDALTGWERHSFDIANHASGEREKDREVEVLWCNFKTGGRGDGLPAAA